MLAIHEFQVLPNHLLSLLAHFISFTSKLGWLTTIWDAADHLAALCFLNRCILYLMHLKELYKL